MLYEVHIVEAVCGKLIKLGYTIDQKLETTQQGFDIIASKNNQEQSVKLYIEAKGETSSQEGTNRFGKVFTSGQVREHIGQALYKVAEIFSLDQPTCEIRAAIALPKNKNHLDQVKKIQKALDRWGIVVFWVSDELNVEIQPFLI